MHEISYIFEDTPSDQRCVQQSERSRALDILVPTLYLCIYIGLAVEANSGIYNRGYVRFEELVTFLTAFLKLKALYDLLHIFAQN